MARRAPSPSSAPRASALDEPAGDTRPKLPHGAWETPDEPVPDDTSSVADICAVDPSACQPPSREMLASCRCNRFRGRDAQRCLIDCVARERSKVDDELKKLGP